MKKILFIALFALLGLTIAAQPYTTISDGESGLSVRTNLNNLINWENALGLDLEFSINGSTSWHYPWASGDLYIRYSDDFGVSWSDAVYLTASDTFFVQVADSLTAYVTPAQLSDSIQANLFVVPQDLNLIVHSLYCLYQI